MNRARYALLFAVATAGLAGGCKQDGTPGAAASSEAAKPAAATLAEALGENAQFSTTAKAFKDTGLEDVLTGKASYTLLAPTNAAFDALGERGKTLAQPEQRAALAALLREHILPGQVTAADLNAALDNAKGRPLRLRSMGKGTLSIAREGDRIMVSSAEGAKAALTADTASAKNGSALGIDGVLKKLT